MATEDDLRRQIRELERRLTQQTAEQEAVRRKNARELTARLNEIRSRTQQDIRRIDAAYERKFHQTQEQFIEQFRRFSEEVRRQEAAAQKQRQQTLEQLRQTHEQLRQTLEEIRRRERQREDAARTLAHSRVTLADEQCARIESMPHDFFFRGQFAILLEHLDAARSMARNGLYDAAAASAEAALSELEILEIRIQESQREWEEAFAVYQAQTMALKDRLEQFESSPLLTPCGSFSLSQRDRDYWSRGHYTAVREEILSAAAVADSVARTGAAAYLMTAGPEISRTHLLDRITGLYRLSERLTALIRCISAERFYSDQRYQMAQDIKPVLFSMGFALVREGYRDGQPMDSYDLFLNPNRSDSIHIALVPLREHGVTVRNVCVTEMDIRSVTSPALMETLAEDILRRLRQTLPDLSGTEWHSRMENKAVHSEQTYKKTPDMLLLAERLERKYPSGP